MPAFDNFLEAFDRVRHLYIFTATTRELLGDKERLRQESLDFPSTRYCKFVLFGKLIDSKNGYDVLEILVLLQDGFDGSRNVVVFCPDDSRVENSRC